MPKKKTTKVQNDGKALEETLKEEMVEKAVGGKKNQYRGQKKKVEKKKTK